MPCYNPRPVFRYNVVDVDTGEVKVRFIFNPVDPHFDVRDERTQHMEHLPCGTCIGCRLDRARDTSIRGMHESQLHHHCCTVDLTYDDDHLPPNGSLCQRDVQLFFKRFRKAIYPKKVRYIYCGEYGSRLQRPHYHLCLFGYDFLDKDFFKKSDKGFPLYTSPLLSKLWDKGHHTIGRLTEQSVAYVARYILKKVNGEKAKDHYGDREPEFVRFSTRPGIGHDWIVKYFGDVYNYDYVVNSKGHKVRPPRYYDKVFSKIDPERFYEIKQKRHKTAEERRLHPDNTYARLSAREEVQAEKTKLLKRAFEE